MADKAELVIMALQQRMGELVSSYETQIAILRADYTRAQEEIDNSKKEKDAVPNEIYGYVTNCEPHNPMYDVKKKLPLFTKSDASKSVYCAGYYAIKFDKGWVRSFCPKLITVQRYESRGPFRTELELKQELANVNR
jgi:hypothetical protein